MAVGQGGAGLGQSHSPGICHLFAAGSPLPGARGYLFPFLPAFGFQELTPHHRILEWPGLQVKWVILKEKTRDFWLNGGFAKRKRVILLLNGGFAKRKRVIFG